MIPTPGRSGLTTDWRSAYEELAARVTAHAGSAAPLLAGFNICVDRVYRPDPETLDAVTAVADTGAPPLARRLRDRIVAGRGGEVFEPSGYAERWLANQLGEPAATQVGGTGAQAAWVLAELGAPSVLALADRSRVQLAVVHPAVGIVTGGEVTPAGRVPPTGRPAVKPPHYIVEFSAGTHWNGGTVPRSSRIIVRFDEDGIERDPAFAAAAPELAGRAGAGLVSGLNGVPDHDRDSRDWLRTVVSTWCEAGLPVIHLELAEYVRPAALVELTAEYAGLVSSLGMSLSELRTFGEACEPKRRFRLAGAAGNPAAAALRIAQRYRLARVFVHADEWSLVVHRGEPEPAAAAVRLGNLLAAARAAHGYPTRSPHPTPTAEYTTDHPASERLGDGWRVSCAPTPYLRRPAATIGLGDTFVAGAMLADCLTRAGAPP